jgi:hypothetical protein
MRSPGEQGLVTDRLSNRPFDLVINLKAATALGLIVPERLLLRADEIVRSRAAFMDSHVATGRY